MSSQPASDELRDDVLRALSALLQRLSSREQPTKRSRLRVLNSPFVVTVLGGLFVTGLTLTWQQSAASNERARSRRIEVLDKRIRLLCELPNSLLASVQLVGEFKPRELWIRRYSKGDDAPRYIDGRDLAQTKQRYEELMEQYRKTRTVDSIVVEVTWVYVSKSVLDKAEEVRLVLSELVALGIAAPAGGTYTDTDLRDALNRFSALYAKADEAYLDLARAMAGEIRTMYEN